MSQQQFKEQASFLFHSSGTNINFNQNIQLQQEELGGTKKTTNRRDDTNSVYEELYLGTYKVRPGERIVLRKSGRKNKNEILGLTLALLTKERYLNGRKYSHDLELCRGIQMNANNGEFILVLRTDGRIVAMSDEVEQHLGKSMRSLYTQCINIYECLDRTDGEKLRSVLNSSVDLTHQEHPLVCTFRLPKGKRPSRTREDIKTITMTGHFYSSNEASAPTERLFIARCEALVARTATGSSSSQTATANNNTNSMFKLALNEDMSISMVSANVRDILGYSRNEMTGNWFGRYLATHDLEKFENIRERYFRHDQQQQQLPTSICDIFDMYTNNGEGRLTFLCQIRPIRERRSKIIKFSIVAQLIDPSIRNECMKYVHIESETNPKPPKAEQVNLVSSSISKTSEDTIMATNSPSLANGLLMFHNAYNDESNHQQQHSPFNRSLSNFVAPINVNDESWQQLFDFDYAQYSATANVQLWPTKSFDDSFVECQFDQGLANMFDDYLDEFYTGSGLF